MHAVLERSLYQAVRRLAKRDGGSLSLKARDLAKVALEAEEDRWLAEIARKRERSFDRSKALTHEEVWAHVRQPRR